MKIMRKTKRKKIKIKRLAIDSEEFLGLQLIAIKICESFSGDLIFLKPQMVDDGWDLGGEIETGVWTHPDVQEVEFYTRKIVQLARAEKIDAFDVSGTRNIKLASNTDFSEITFLGQQITNVLADNEDSTTDHITLNKVKHSSTTSTGQLRAHDFASASTLPTQELSSASTSTENTNKYLEALADWAEYLIKRYRIATKTQHLKKVESVKAFIKVEIEREYNYSCSSSELDVLKNILQSAFPADINSRSDKKI